MNRALNETGCVFLHQMKNSQYEEVILSTLGNQIVPAYAALLQRHQFSSSQRPLLHVTPPSLSPFPVCLFTLNLSYKAENVKKKKNLQKTKN